MGQKVLDLATRVNVDFRSLVTLYANELVERNRNRLAYIDEFGPDFLECELADPKSVKVLEVFEGHGRHTHDEECQYGQATINRACYRSCDDSDFVVRLAYTYLNGSHSGKECWADFGVLNGVNTLWAD